MRRTLGITAGLLPVCLTVLAVVAPTQAAARRDTPDVTIKYLVAGGGLLVTEGGGDVVGIRLGVAVDQPARTVVTITNHSGQVVRGPVSLGTLRPGRHFWKWGERRNDGTRVRDGGFTATVDATFAASGLTQEWKMGLGVDSVYRPGRVHIGYRTIYPRSTATHDATTVSNRAYEYARTAMVVRSAAGNSSTGSTSRGRRSATGPPGTAATRAGGSCRPGRTRSGSPARTGRATAARPLPSASTCRPGSWFCGPTPSPCPRTPPGTSGPASTPVARSGAGTRARSSAGPSSPATGSASRARSATARGATVGRRTCGR